MTDTVSDGPLSTYLGKMRHFLSLYPDCFGYLEVAEEKARFELMPQLRREMLSEAGTENWPAKQLMDQLLLKVAKATEFWQEELINKIVSFRLAPSKRARLTPNESGVVKRSARDGAVDPSDGRNPNRVRAGTRPNKPGTKRQFCRAYQRGECKADRCPNMCTVTNKPRLHICDKCFKPHAVPRGEEYRQEA